jgi:hypothetical protein
MSWLGWGSGVNPQYEELVGTSRIITLWSHYVPSIASFESPNPQATIPPPLRQSALRYHLDVLSYTANTRRRESVLPAQPPLPPVRGYCHRTRNHRYDPVKGRAAQTGHAEPEAADSESERPRADVCV